MVLVDCKYFRWK